MKDLSEKELDSLKKLSRELIDKLFTSMNIIYAERWRKIFPDDDAEERGKSIWQSALYGCTYDEIKTALYKIKKASVERGSYVPNQLEFYRICKGISTPYGYNKAMKPAPIPEKIDAEFSRQRYQQKSLQKINSRLKFKY